MTDLEREKWPDDVRRVRDEMTMHAVAKSRGWAVFSMADGTPLTHDAYDTWNDAVKAARWNRDNYMFLEIQPDGMTYREAEAVLKYARTMSKMGFRIPSPDWDAGPMISSMPHQPHDRRRMIRQLISGTPLYPEGSSNLPSVLRKEHN